jgi:spore maturation protein CgeB
LIVFIGNEYDLMAEKIDFIRKVEADYVCSQLPIETAEWLYSGCDSAKILPMPHALNPEIYYPSISVKERKIDIGFIGAIYPYFIGDIERRNFLEFVKKNAGQFNLRCDMRFLNVPRKQWALFLNSCKGIIGAEAGTYFLDREGCLLRGAKEYIKRHPQASFEEVYGRFFKKPGTEYISGKAISSRHFESIGAKTCQILLEGYYNGILKPDIHYISVKKDLSNVRDALERFKDENFREKLVKEAYEYVMAEHTYRHRIETLLNSIA